MYDLVELMVSAAAANLREIWIVVGDVEEVCDVSCSISCSKQIEVISD